MCSLQIHVKESDRRAYFDKDIYMYTDIYTGQGYFYLF